MTTPLYDDSNWREEYKGFTKNKHELELLENGPKNLSQSWHLQALYLEEDEGIRQTRSQIK